MGGRAERLGDVARWGFALGLADAMWYQIEPPPFDGSSAREERQNYERFRATDAFLAFDELRRRQFFHGYEQGFAHGMRMDDPFASADFRRWYPGPRKPLGPEQ